VTAVLAIHGLVAGYGQGDVLRGVDLELEPETITCVIGPNGAGKSTVLKAVSGLVRPTRGTIALAGRPLAGLSPRRVLEAGVVHVPQERSLFPLMTVFENVLVGGHVLKDSGLARRRAEAIAARFPLVAERRQSRAGSLSGGSRRSSRSPAR
jgi:branched-chain amino acid transport system ATP-binding protein